MCCWSLLAWTNTAHIEGGEGGAQGQERRHAYLVSAKTLHVLCMLVHRKSSFNIIIASACLRIDDGCVKWHENYLIKNKSLHSTI